MVTIIRHYENPVNISNIDGIKAELTLEVLLIVSASMMFALGDTVMQSISIFANLNAFFSENLEIIGTVIVSVVTFVASAYFRIRKHHNDLELAEKKHAIEIQRLEFELQKEKDLHELDLQIRSEEIKNRGQQNDDPGENSGVGMAL